MAVRIPRVPVREQDPKVRAHNFEEVCLGYNLEEATLEASRCLHCKNPRCVTACPVAIKIPEFIAKVKEGDIAGAAAVIAEDSSLPAVCGRVCPQETQCEGSCVLGVKGEPVAIGKLERFVADHTFASVGEETLPPEGRATRGTEAGGPETEKVERELVPLKVSTDLVGSDAVRLLKGVQPSPEGKKISGQMKMVSGTKPASRQCSISRRPSTTKSPAERRSLDFS